MKVVFVISLTMLSGICFSQTVEIESEIINRQFTEGKVSQFDAQEKAKAWREIRAQYPVIPYDTVSGRVVVDKVIKFEGVGKDIAFKRSKEWAALHFNKLGAVIEYEDYASGKLILEGFVEIRHVISYDGLFGGTKTRPTKSDLYFSLVLTFVDGRAKVSYHNLRYKHFVPGYTLANVYVPSEWQEYSFESLFPIVRKDHSAWKGLMDTVLNTMAELNATAPSLEKYILDYQKDYRF